MYREKLLNIIKNFANDGDGNIQEIPPKVFGFLADVIIEAMCEADSNAVLGDVREIVKMYDAGEIPIKFLSTENLVKFIDIMYRLRLHVA